jgi:hypothetical protein
MSGRDITAVIGQNTYYEAVGTKRSFNDGNNDVDAYLVKITKADDRSRVGKFALIKSTRKAGAQPSADQYVTDISYGEQCKLLEQLNTPEKLTLSTRTFDGTAPVDNPDKQGTKKPTETIADKEWNLKANQTEWRGLGASLPSGVTQACSASPAAAGSVPAVSNTDLGEVNADDASAKVDIKFDKNIVAANTDGSINMKVNGTDKTLASDGYTIAGDTLSINKIGIDALGITNATAANKLIVNADQVADKADPTKKNVATGELALQAKAPAAPDSNPTPLITTTETKFNKAGPIELTFENPLRLAPGKSLDSSNITILQVDEGGQEVKGGAVPTDLTYAIDPSDSRKLRITTPTGFTAEKRYQVVFQPGLLMPDAGNEPYAAQIGYTFKAITPTVE